MAEGRGSGRGHGGGSVRGVTLVEFAVVLFVLGLVLWLAVPRLALRAGRDRNAVFREIAAGSEAAFDTALFEKREIRLVIDPAAGTFRFRPGTVAEGAEGPPPREFGEGLTVAGITVEGEDRPPDIATEIRYQPGGRVPAVLIFLREEAGGESFREWTLRINPFDGSVDVVEGRAKA